MFQINQKYVFDTFLLICGFSIWSNPNLKNKFFDYLFLPSEKGFLIIHDHSCLCGGDDLCKNIKSSQKINPFLVNPLYPASKHHNKNIKKTSLCDGNYPFANKIVYLLKTSEWNEYVFG